MGLQLLVGRALGVSDEFLDRIALAGEVEEPALVQGPDSLAHVEGVGRQMPRWRRLHGTEEQPLLGGHGSPARVVLVLDLQPEGLADQVRSQAQPFGRVARIG